MPITDQQKSDFQRDGFLILERIVSDEQVARARAAIKRIWRGQITRDRRPAELREPLPDRSAESPGLKHIVNGRLLDADLWDVMTDERLGADIAKLLETGTVSLTEDQLFEKPPGCKPIAMHQDRPYQRFARGHGLTTVWIALTDMTIDMGPLEYIPGSHLWDVGRENKVFADGDEDAYMIEAERIRPPGAKLDTVPVLVEAGGGGIHHSRCMHGSRRNTSGRPRGSMAMHHAAWEVRMDTSGKLWHPAYWEGLADGDPIVNDYFPVVYRASSAAVSV